MELTHTSFTISRNRKLILPISLDCAIFLAAYPNIRYATEQSIWGFWILRRQEKPGDNRYDCRGKIQCYYI